MTIADERLKQFFSKQKVGAFDALKQPSKVSPKSNSSDNLQDSPTLSNQTINPEKVENDSDILEQTPVVVEIVDNKNEDKIAKLADKHPAEPLAIHNQTVSEPLAIQQQPVSEPLSISEHLVSKALSEPLAIPLAKSPEIHFADLRVFSKKERDMLTLIFWQCHNNCSLTSPPISTEEIRHTLKISAERVRNLIFRISKKGGIKVTQHKSGQSAYRVFELSKSLYQWMIDHQNNRVVRMNDSLAAPLANPLATALYSSSNINKTTTSLPEDWKKINFEHLSSIGFTENQLKQIYETNLSTAEIVQDSINHFAYGLMNSEKTKAYKEPINVFMGVLRKGQRWFEADYISPRELALKQILNEKRKAKERQDALIKEMVDMEFPEWRQKLSDSQIKLIVPEPTLRMNISSAITACLRTHYVEKILLPRLEKNEINVE